MGIISGIISGCYSGIVISRFTIFNNLKRESLRIIRRFDYEENKISGDKKKNQIEASELSLIVSDFIYIGQKKAGEKILAISNKLNNIICHNSDNIDIGIFFSDVQEGIRTIKINWINLFNPFNPRT